jgi:hypothetical protein
VFYENYIGSIIDWYAATLMRREAALVFDGSDEAAKGLLQRLCGGLRPEGHFPGGVLPPADRANAGAGPKLHRGGFSAIAGFSQ